MSTVNSGLFKALPYDPPFSSQRFSRIYLQTFSKHPTSILNIHFLPYPTFPNQLKLCKLSQSKFQLATHTFYNYFNIWG